MITLEQLTKELPPLPEGATFRFSELRSINHKPHPFCITPRHVAYAADRYGGRLSADAIRQSHAPCGIGRAGSPIRGEQPCCLSYDEHTSELVLFVAIKHTPNNLNDVPGLGAYLVQCKETAEKHKIDGFAFAFVEE